MCGEETALLASVEGRMGEPCPRPPFPAEKGLWGCPTVINNVETWANVPLILVAGADLYRGAGTEASRGTKVFSLVGDVTNTGLVEAPMGTPLRHVVEVMGGGLSRGSRIKAVQTGGPSVSAGMPPGCHNGATSRGARHQPGALYPVRGLPGCLFV
ncbi:MAG: SLBB domain-containing protein [Bacillota bacterium]|nr:SLBB domain-containing protein [Bacillota bacterium]